MLRWHHLVQASICLYNSTAKISICIFVRLARNICIQFAWHLDGNRISAQLEERNNPLTVGVSPSLHCISSVNYKHNLVMAYGVLLPDIRHVGRTGWDAAVSAARCLTSYDVQCVTRPSLIIQYTATVRYKNQHSQLTVIFHHLSRTDKKFRLADTVACWL